MSFLRNKVFPALPEATKVVAREKIRSSPEGISASIEELWNTLWRFG
jgi:hypothetical protein